MASTKTNLPAWLLLSKDDITRSVEWKDLTSELFDAVQHQLTENHVSYFSDLTDSEKVMFLDRAGKLVRDSSSYQKLMATVSETLDRNLNEEVTQTIIDASNTRTKAELLLQESSKASISLLQRWPDLKTKLFACLNRPLPTELRRAVWNWFLANPIVRKEYLEKLSRNKQDTVSRHDAAIGQKCKAFLSSESSHFRLESYPALLNIMKTSISYRDVKEFLLAQKQFGSKMADYLNSKDQQLALTLQRIFSHDQTTQLAESLAAIMRSYARCMFVGFLSLDVVCYIWDQYILSMKLPSFNCIATFSAVMLLLLRDEILVCRNTKEIEEVLLAGSKKLTIRDFQRVIDHHFMADWQRLVTEEVHGSDLPLVDPVATVGRSAHPWSGWFRGQPPTRQRVEDRRQTREEREQERRRQLMEHRREEARKKQEQKEEMRRREQEMRQEFQAQKKREKEGIVALEKELKRERQERSSVEKKKDEEIARLQVELARLKRVTPVTSPAIRSSGAPSVKEPTPVNPSPRLSRASRQQVEDMVRSLLGATLHSLDLVAHGSEEQRTNLDIITKDALQTNSDQYKEAERELFGRELNTDDWDRMDEEERSENTRKLMTRLKEMRDESRLNAT
ncbi:uncharacterized protein LOC113665481 isoform X2 [Pocillopora damicornis]|uniref:uncharacterized protein LOC113665481 isoform X2 n=1 Tax=Pocillopora damicornis TaxID=46731 RepID=UPI000F5552AD|nr:uncharacterized protein LOC113665481 isoform X2 [Pocillopora damicornis]